MVHRQMSRLSVWMWPLQATAGTRPAGFTRENQRGLLLRSTFTSVNFTSCHGWLFNSSTSRQKALYSSTLQNQSGMAPSCFLMFVCLLVAHIITEIHTFFSQLGLGKLRDSFLAPSTLPIFIPALVAALTLLPYACNMNCSLKTHVAVKHTLRLLKFEVHCQKKELIMQHKYQCHT